MLSAPFVATLLDLGLRAGLAFGARGGEIVVNDSYFGTIMFELSQSRAEIAREWMNENQLSVGPIGVAPQP